MKKIIGIIIGILGAVLSVIGIILKVKGDMSVSIPSGADGLTTVFVVGTLGGDFAVCFIMIGIILLVAAGFICFKRKR